MNRLPKRTWLSILILLILIPATLYLCFRMGNRHYYLASLLIILYTLIPFFLVFEHRRPQARELVVLAVLCALAIASRAAFVWLPNFKPICGVIMIAGVAFGPESGFLVGAVSAFGSNFIFGQGAWTPWQMFAFGLAGFLAGLFYRLRIINKNRVVLAVFGFLTIMLIVGPALDTCALFLMANELNASSAGAVYLSGLPVNLVHAGAVALTMFFFSRPMFEKLDRIRLKYGMLED